MCGIAISRLHLSREEFYYLTPIEFHYALIDVNEQRKIDQRFELEKMRIQTFYLLNIQLSKNDKFDSPLEMMPFEWDKIKAKEVLTLTSEDWTQIEERFKIGA